MWHVLVCVEVSQHYTANKVVCMGTASSVRLFTSPLTYLNNTLLNHKLFFIFVLIIFFKTITS